MPLILTLGPSVTMGMASVATASFSITNALSRDGSIRSAMPSAIMAGSMLLGTMVWPLLSKKFEKARLAKLERKRKKKYRAYLEKVRKNINDEIKMQEEILNENYIPINECIDRIIYQKRNLWERLPEHNDFLSVRLGLGDLPFNAEISFAEEHFTIEEDELLESMYKLANEPKVLKNVPVSVSFTESYLTGIIGERALVLNFVKNIIFQLTALHSYACLKLIFIYDEKEEFWQFVKWIPHVWTNNQDVRFIASNSDSLKYISSYIEKIMDNYQNDKNKNKEDIDCHYMIVAADNDMCKKNSMINRILNMKEYCGFSLLTLYDELKHLPKECMKVIEISEEDSKIYDKKDISGKYQSFTADLCDNINANDIAVKLANIKIDLSDNLSHLPDMLSFLEMYNVQKIEHLNCLEKWNINNPVLSLKSPIGVDSNGDLIYLDLHEKYHGPHGLIAGMTGSGKSEFIMTFILSLAVNYHPYEVAFILIDYKGGGMANAFTNLPHLAGTITNLDGSAVNRSLLSIQSELKRRQAIFSQTSKKVGMSNIDIYKYQKLFREGTVEEPLQHLFIISDEFAELKTQQPEFMKELVSAARIGRSLGIHLILATQKPAGVVDDQIWSNSRFRICLKVQESADSNDVIKRPDAASLSTTGRFYMQVGYNEVFELGQSAWAGAPYYPNIDASQLTDDSIIYIDEIGRNIKQVSNSNKIKLPKNPPKQLDEITKYINKLADEEKIAIRHLWLEPIPAVIYVDELIKKYNCTSNKFELNPVIGEYDDPKNQQQCVLRLPISDKGNVLIYGSAGMGKTTLLATIVYSIISNHTTEEVSIFILDFGSETLRCFNDSPIVSDVLCSYDEEKMSYLFKFLHSEIEKRKQLFIDTGGDYNSYIKSGQAFKSILVIIQNYSSFSECFPDYEEKVLFLSREGSKYGIYFIITSLSTNGIRYKLLQNFSQTLCLQLNDNDYNSVLGSTGRMIPAKIKGRGFIKTDDLYEFQTAYVFKPENNISSLKEYSQKQKSMVEQTDSFKIPTLPEIFDITYFNGELQEYNSFKIPIGINKESLEVENFEFSTYIMAITYKDNNSYNCVDGILEMLLAVNTQQVIVFDPNGNLSYIDQTIDYYKSMEEINSGVNCVFEEVLARYKQYKIAQRDGKETPSFDSCFVIVSDFKQVYETLEGDEKEMMKLSLEKGFSQLNIRLIIVDNVNNLSNYSYKSWFKDNSISDNYIWIGKGISKQYVFKNNVLSKSIKQSNDDENYGYCVRKSNAKFVKLISKTGVKNG